jgi:hypothetical protein
LRNRVARHRAAQRARGLRPVVLWLPDVTDPAYQLRLAAECRCLAQLTPDEKDMAADFAVLAGHSGYQVRQRALTRVFGV